MNRPPSLEEHVDRLTDRVASLEALTHRLDIDLQQLAAALGTCARRGFVTAQAGAAVQISLDALTAIADRIRDH